MANEFQKQIPAVLIRPKNETKNKGEAKTLHKLETWLSYTHRLRMYIIWPVGDGDGSGSGGGGVAAMMGGLRIAILVPLMLIIICQYGEIVCIFPYSGFT